MSALDIQEGGSHYKDLAIQPVEYIKANNIPFIEGNVIKYVTRHRAKNGAADIRKAIHFLELLLEFDYPEEEKQMTQEEFEKLPPQLQEAMRVQEKAAFFGDLANTRNLTPALAPVPTPEVHQTVAEKLASSKLKAQDGVTKK